MRYSEKGVRMTDRLIPLLLGLNDLIGLECTEEKSRHTIRDEESRDYCR